MPNDNEKLARFEKAVFSEMENKAAEILSEVDSYKQDKLDGVEDAELQRAYDQIQRRAAEIRAGFARDITKEKLAARQSVLLRRKELTEELFTKAADRLLEFTTGEAYRNWLLELLKAHQPLAGKKILAKAGDLEFVKSAAKSAQVESGSQIRFGGLIFVDEANHSYEEITLDSRLEEAEQRFYQSGKAGLEQVEGVGELG